MKKQYLGAEIRRLYEAAGFDQQELATGVGLHYMTISMWENARKVPSSANLVRALRFCTVDERKIDELHRITDELVEGAK